MNWLYLFPAFNPHRNDSRGTSRFHRYTQSGEISGISYDYRSWLLYSIYNILIIWFQNLPSMKIRRKLPEVDCIYPTPPSSTSEYINSFNPLSPSTVPYSNTVLAPMSHYPESNNFLNAHFAQPHPIHFNNIDPSYESYWIPPTPIMPQFVDHFQYQNADENYMYQSGCKNENINYWLLPLYY